MLEFFEYINTVEFLAYGFLVYYIFFPLFAFLVVWIFEFFWDYVSFRDYRNEQKLKMTKEEIEQQIKTLLIT